MFYTHSKPIAVFVICLSVIVSVLVYERNSRKDTAKTENPILVEVNKEVDVDSDGDGVKDWEEALFGTDPNKKDTDGDGILDNEESQDQFVFKEKESIDSQKPQNNSLTSDIAQTFFTNYLTQKKSNPDLTAEQILAIAENSTKDIALSYGKQFEVTDIKISKNQTKSQYEKEIDTAFFGASIKKQDTEIQIVEKALKNNDKNELKKLDPIINSYQKIIDDTLKITVPEDNVGLHLVYLNTLKILKQDISNMKLILDDPVKAYVYINSYQVNIKKMLVVILKMSDYFSKK